jgi:hypothetical protein
MSSAVSTNEPERLDAESLPQATAVREALRHILESHPFHASKQCQDLLRYIVDQSLGGDDASLKERVIGAEVFGRERTYDTAEDPVVRVRAADVRKRLAQYYQSPESGKPSLHIELLPGSYRAHFRQKLPAPVSASVPVPLAAPGPTPMPLVPAVIPPESVNPSRESTSPVVPGAGRLQLWPRTILVMALAIAAIAGLFRLVQPLFMSPQERFWAPLTASKQPVLIYMGSNAVYVFEPDYLTRYAAEHGIVTDGPEFFVDLPPDASIRFGDLRPTPSTFVSVCDLAASVQLATLMTDWRKPFVLRSSRDISFGDLRNRPGILIGGFNNVWTLELTKNLPYSLHNGTQIVSRDHPEQRWTMTPHNGSGGTDDYALISRLPVSETGGPLMTIAGVGQYGTQAAAEFVASPEKLRDLLKNAPRGWENKNMQAVLHIKVVGFAPVAIDVVATDYW